MRIIQPVITCLKTMCKTCLKVTKRYPNTSLKLCFILYCSFWKDFTHCSAVSIDNFQQVNTTELLLETTLAYQVVRNVRFPKNFACFVFLKHPFWYSPFCLITDEIYFSVSQFWLCLKSPTRFNNSYLLIKSWSTSF